MVTNINYIIQNIYLSFCSDTYLFGNKMFSKFVYTPCDSQLNVYWIKPV